jgi:hypothetical protein
LGTNARPWLAVVEPMFMARFGPVRFSDKLGSKIGLNPPKTVTAATLDCAHPDQFKLWNIFLVR